jgi:hydroxylamine reductase (hybrid-cluster protein)
MMCGSILENYFTLIEKGSFLAPGIQDIRIGPKPPEFVSSGVLEVLVELFGLKLITTAEEDMNAMLALL